MSYVPSLGQTGRFTFKPPFVAGNDQLTVVSLRSFGELQQQGIDPYTTYYVPAGLVDGQTLNGLVFNFKAEQGQNPIIVSLKNSRGKIVHVPNTYMNTMPAAASSTYVNKHIVLTMGAYPKDEKLTSIIDDLKDRALTITNETITATLVVTPISPAMTQTEINDLETLRKNNRRSQMTVFEQLKSTQAQLAESQKTVQTLTNVLRQHGLLT